MGIDKNEWGFRVGHLPHGERNKISDVPGVTVGHCTLADGDIQTGVTALLPHPGDVFHDKVLAACHVINGFGKTTGLVQIDELGTLETPILFTNTLSVGTVETALVKYMLERNPDICETTGSVNPVVCECNDCGLNDIRGLHVTEAHVAAALADCKADFAEGAVGAGRGMRCHGLKGGIGSASRLVELDGKSYTIGAMVLSNHATFDDLIVAGTPIHELLEARIPPHEDKGSIITVLATDIPLSGGSATGRWWGFPAPAVPAATVRVRSFWPLPRPTGCRITRKRPSCPWRCSTMMPSTRCSGRWPSVWRKAS